MLRKLSFSLVAVISVTLLGACANTSAVQYRTLNFDTRVYVGDVPLDVVVFDTPEERELGLMHVKELPEGKGALFVFEREEIVSFWMKDVQFSVDMLFFDKSGQLVQKLEEVEPCKFDKCRTVSMVRARYVLEVSTEKTDSARMRLGDALSKQDPQDW